jgi:hypothetical protein
MVDLSQSPASSDSQRSDPTPPNNPAYDRRNGAGSDNSVEPVVVGRHPGGDIPVLVDEFAPDAGVLMEPWLLTENDLPWLIFLCKKKYESRYDPISTEQWFRNIVLKSPLMFLPVRMPNSFMICMLSTLPWIPSEFDCNVVFICADDGHMWEAMKLLRHSIEWAKKRKCKRWRLCSDTETDLTMMARRVGAWEISPRYTIEF